jgi:hypothetical protein
MWQGLGGIAGGGALARGYFFMPVPTMNHSCNWLPDLVCRLIEVGVEAFKTEAGDISKAGAMVAGDLSKIVIRLYTQSDDEKVKKRCLDAIDVMEQAGFFGLSDELRRLDR